MGSAGQFVYLGRGATNQTLIRDQNEEQTEFRLLSENVRIKQYKTAVFVMR
jgi:hypothetical protein